MLALVVWLWEGGGSQCRVRAVVPSPCYGWGDVVEPPPPFPPHKTIVRILIRFTTPVL